MHDTRFKSSLEHTSIIVNNRDIGVVYFGTLNLNVYTVCRTLSASVCHQYSHILVTSCHVDSVTLSYITVTTYVSLKLLEIQTKPFKCMMPSLPKLKLFSRMVPLGVKIVVLVLINLFYLWNCYCKYIHLQLAIKKGEHWNWCLKSLQYI